MTTEFKPGDIVEVSNVALKGQLFRVVECWPDPQISRLLLTDVDQTSMKCLPVLTQDCTLVRQEEYIRNTYKTPKHEQADQRLLDSKAEDKRLNGRD